MITSLEASIKAAMHEYREQIRAELKTSVYAEIAREMQHSVGQRRAMAQVLRRIADQIESGQHGQI